MTLEDYEIKKAELLKDFSKNHGNAVINTNKKTSNLFRDRAETKKEKIKLNYFNKVISIDEKNLICQVEGMITFEDLVTETLKYGLLPCVVPQLKTITLGGAISGIGIEASSFQYGLVHETVIEMDIFLSNGKIVTCSPTKNSDLFFSIPNSYATLGYIMSAKIKLIKSKPYIKLEYKKYTDNKLFFKDLENYCKKSDNNYIDGVVFSKDEMYICLGNFTDNFEHLSNYKYMKIFYKSIQKKKYDFLTVSDYIWRWDSDWFWCSKVFMVQNPIIRFIFGKFMLNSRSYNKIKKFNHKYKLVDKITKFKRFFGIKEIKKEAVIQDVALPIGACVDFLDFFSKNIGITPIWVCPTKDYNKNHRFKLFETNPNILYVDFGFWDVIDSDTDKLPGHYNKLIENELIKLKGIKSLYSESFYSREKFYEIYNGIDYFKVKKKYDSDGKFKELYEKCVMRG